MTVVHLLTPDHAQIEIRKLCNLFDLPGGFYGLLFVSVQFGQSSIHPSRLINLLPEVFWGGRGAEGRGVGVLEGLKDHGQV